MVDMYYGNRFHMFGITLYCSVDYMWKNFEDILEEHMFCSDLDNWDNLTCDEKEYAVIMAIINYLEWLKEEEMDEECPTDDDGTYLCKDGVCYNQIGITLCKYNIEDMLSLKYYYDIDKLNDCIRIEEVDL